MSNKKDKGTSDNDTSDNDTSSIIGNAANLATSFASTLTGNTTTEQTDEENDKQEPMAVKTVCSVPEKLVVSVLYNTFMRYIPVYLYYVIIGMVDMPEKDKKLLQEKLMEASNVKIADPERAFLLDNMNKQQVLVKGINDIINTHFETYSEKYIDTIQKTIKDIFPKTLKNTIKEMNTEGNHSKQFGGDEDELSDVPRTNEGTNELSVVSPIVDRETTVLMTRILEDDKLKEQMQALVEKLASSLDTTLLQNATTDAVTKMVEELGRSRDTHVIIGNTLATAFATPVARHVEQMLENNKESIADSLKLYTYLEKIKDKINDNKIEINKNKNEINKNKNEISDELINTDNLYLPKQDYRNEMNKLLNAYDEILKSLNNITSNNISSKSNILGGMKKGKKSRRTRRKNRKNKKNKTR